ncbi:GNAT family N-acetyltransferase [Frateuria aurantia]
MQLMTPRLMLRRPGMDDLSEFLSCRNHPAVLPWLGPAIDAQRAGELLARQTVLPLEQGSAWHMLAIVGRNDGRMLGEVGFFLSEDRAQADLGWMVHPDQQGQGIATEAGRALLTHLFDRLHLHRVTAACELDNRGSWHLMERLGMRREAMRVQSRRGLRGWVDEVGYALLASEWPGATALQDG